MHHLPSSAKVYGRKEKAAEPQPAQYTNSIRRQRGARGPPAAARL